ncbi:MAG: RNA-directed DNA polymerase [Lewinellaceae bacterium]|nr:RNA-directed DNA polymerase [Lewinellaceae bacterium]
MADTITIQGMRNRAKRFLSSGTLEGLALSLGKASLKLLALAEQPSYNEFRIPKKSGGMRRIEDPTPELKKAQRKLNDYLQAVYHFQRTDAAYGFLANPVDDPSPRHILSNARVHMGCRWLLNVDAKDFFHMVSEERVKQVFQSGPFHFEEPIAGLLASLCCYKGRLPMGAPTSPILSNFASVPMDHALMELARKYDWKYTRYADDMTFSAQEEITEAHFAEVGAIIRSHGFLLNPEKKKHYGPEDEDKEVTGLLVRESRIDLPEGYLEQLEKAIDHLDKAIDAKYSMASGRGQKTAWLEELEQQIRGKLEYARQILGEGDLLYLDLVVQLDEALTPPDYYGPMAWLDFGYALPK